MITNKKYNIRFPHDFPEFVRKTNYINRTVPLRKNDHNKFKLTKRIIKKHNICNYFDIFKDSYERKINRFKNLLINENKILFIRFEESQKDRIIYDVYKHYLNKTDLEYIKDFSNIIKKEYPNLEFKIIYISKTFDINYIKENNIIILRLDEDTVDWNDCGSKFKMMFEKYKSFLEKTRN